MTEHDLHIDADVWSRFERHRQETATEFVPPMQPNTFMSSLLDTYEAAQGGYYTDLTDHVDLQAAHREELDERQRAWLQRRLNSMALPRTVIGP